MTERDIKSVVESIREIKSAGKPDGAFTTKDLILQLRCSRDRADALIRDAIDLGLCQFVGRLPRDNRIGGTNRIPHYKWVDDLKEKA